MHSLAEDLRVRGLRAEAVATDVADAAALDNLVKTTLRKFERIDILVNASRQVLTTDPLDADDSSVEDLLEQNLLTSLRMSRAVAKRMIRQAEADEGDGPISSNSASSGSPDQNASSKASDAARAAR